MLISHTASRRLQYVRDATGENGSLEVDVVFKYITLEDHHLNTIITSIRSDLPLKQAINIIIIILSVKLPQVQLHYTPINMHSSRTIVRVPQVCRIHKAMPTARSLSYLPTPFIPRFTNSGFGFPIASHDFGFPTISHDFAPLFRLLDDMTSIAHAAPAPAPPRPVLYQPRFDVREVDGHYEFRGELPGVEQQDLSVEFSDAQTLVIRGRTSHETSNKPEEQQAQPEKDQQQQQQQPEVEQQTVNTTTAAAAEEATLAPSDNSDAISTHSTTSYQKPSVQDAIEDGADEAAAAPSTPGVATPASSPSPTLAEESAKPAASTSAAETSTSTSTSAPTQAQEQTSSPKQQQQQQQPTPSPPHHWMTERRTGEFQRTFTFPRHVRVDHDNVRASLKNGVLSIVVPKASSRAVSRRIQVE